MCVINTSGRVAFCAGYIKNRKLGGHWGRTEGQLNQSPLQRDDVVAVMDGCDVMDAAWVSGPLKHASQDEPHTSTHTIHSPTLWRSLSHTHTVLLSSAVSNIIE